MGQIDVNENLKGERGKERRECVEFSWLTMNNV